MLRAYQALLPAVRRVLPILARFSAGAAELCASRSGLMDRWKKADLGQNRIWVHVSSVGELEQVRPVLEHLQSRGFSVVLSYFSSSVPKLVKDWGFVKFADFLPLDFPEDMEALMAIVRPRLLVLNRYDLWPNHLAAARKLGVPVVLVNASTPPIGWFGRLSLWARRGMFRAVDAWAFVDAAAAAAWEPYVFGRVRGEVTGDPRVDRVLQRVEAALRQKKARERIALWQKRPFCLVAGSTWPEDEEIVIPAWAGLKSKGSLVLVPHEPEESHLAGVEKALEANGLSWVRYSALQSPVQADVLLVDERGILAELYGLGNLAYVGGGFRRQTHSIIEPISHGLPVAIGPNFLRSPEAVTLHAAGPVASLPKYGGVGAFRSWVEAMSDPEGERAKLDEPIRVFLQIHRGAGHRVAEFLVGCLDLQVRGAGDLGMDP